MQYYCCRYGVPEAADLKWRPAVGRSVLQHEAVVHAITTLQVALYEGAGFGLIGPSSVVHGQDVWLEMRLDFSDSADGLDWCVGA